MGKHRNPKQEEILLKFMTGHSGLACGYVKGDRVAVESLWKKLSEELNASGPHIKDCNGWKKVWIDWKTTIRRKLAHNRAETTATGGGEFNIIAITANEKEVARICGFFKVVGGIKGSMSVGIRSFPSKTDFLQLTSSDDDTQELVIEPKRNTGTMKKIPVNSLNIPEIVEDDIAAFNSIAFEIDAQEPQLAIEPKTRNTGTTKKRPVKSLNIPEIVEDEIAAFNSTSTKNDAQQPKHTIEPKNLNAGTTKKRTVKSLNIPEIVEDEIAAFNNIASKIDALTEVILQGNGIMKKLCEMVEALMVENRRHNLFIESQKKSL